jgi:hypothetical protein
MPTEWTRDLVCRVLEDAFRAHPSLPVHSRWSVAPVATVLNVEISMNWEARFPFLAADRREDWTCLRLRAQCQAERVSMLGRSRSLGLSRKRFESGWRRAADELAAALNDERAKNEAARRADEAAKERLAREGRIRLTPAAPGFVLVDKAA